MDHIERVHRTIKHIEPDRVPHGEWLIDQELMSRLLGRTIQVNDPFYDTIEVANLLDLDLKGVDCTFESSPYKRVLGKSRSGTEIYKDAFGVVYEHSKVGSLDSGVVESPIKNPEEVYEYRFPPIDYYERNVKEIERWVKQTDFFVGACVWGGLTLVCPLTGFENYMLWSITHPRELGYLIRKFTEYYAEVAKKYVDAGAHMILVPDDLAYDQGPFLCPDFYKKILIPALKEEISIIKKHIKGNNKDTAVFFHSHGNINWILQDLLELGIDGLKPLEPQGMDIGRIKKKYGDRLCLMGNVDTRYTLARGTPQEVEEEVKKIIEQAARGGGLIICSADILQADFPVENVVAMCRAVKKYGNYPLRIKTV